MGAEPAQKADFDSDYYQGLLKAGLQSWRTNAPFDTIPPLKEHLQSEWELERSRAKTKRKRNDDESDLLEGTPPKKATRA